MKSRITKIEESLGICVRLLENVRDLMNKTIEDTNRVKNLLTDANSLIRNSKNIDKIIKSIKRKSKRNLDMSSYQIKKIRRIIETISNRYKDIYTLLPKKYQKKDFEEINKNLLNLVKPLNFTNNRINEITNKLNHENFNFNNIISELTKIKIDDDFYLTDCSLENLLSITSEMYNNRENISREIDKEEIITFDAAKEFRSLENAKYILSIIDADFISSLQKLSSTLKEKTLKLSFPGQIIIPKKVIREVTYSPAGILHPLSSRRLISYLSQQLDAKVTEVNIGENNKKIILDLWKEHTNQGKKASPSDEQKFVNSGDMSILGLCCELNPKPIVIFSNNKSEIEKIGRILRKKNLAYILSVVNFDEVYFEVL